MTSQRAWTTGSEASVTLRRVLQLRADPWTPDHGMGFEARLDETPATADPDVESSDWSRPFSPGEHPETPVWFVDGVRRIELRVLADDDAGRRGPGLFGSWACARRGTTMPVSSAARCAPASASSALASSRTA